MLRCIVVVLVLIHSRLPAQNASLDSLRQLTTTAPKTETRALAATEMAGLFLETPELYNADSFQRYITLALDNAEKSGLDSIVAQTHLRAGTLYTIFGQLDKGEAYLLEAIREFTQMGNFAGEMQARWRISNMYRTQFDLLNSTFHLDQTVDLARRTGNLIMEARALGNLSINTQLLGDPEEAYRLGKSAVEVASRSGDPLARAKAFRDCSISAVSLHKYDEAVHMTHQSLELRKIHGNPRLVSNTSFTLADIYLRQCRLDSAEYYARQSLDIAEKLHLDIDIIESNYVLAQVCLQRQAPKDAVRYANAGLEACYRSNNREKEAAILNIRASAWMQLGEDQNAAKDFQHAFFTLDSLHQRHFAISFEYLRNTYRLKAENAEYHLQMQQIQSKKNLAYFASGFLLIMLVTGMMATMYILRSKRKLESVYRTISQQKQVLEESAREKDRLYSILAHDIRAPLRTGETLLCEMELSGDVKPDQIALLRRQCAKTLLYTENMLFWMKNQIGRCSNSPSFTDIHQLVSQTAALYTLDSKHKKISIQNNIPRAYCLWIDPYLLQTILRNLITNALKVSPNGSNITIGLREKRDCICLHISDQGPGLPPDILQKLSLSEHVDPQFLDFKHGFGLYLSLQMVHLMGGRLEVSSTDTGTTFTIKVDRN